jgi:hypothetical protein
MEIEIKRLLQIGGLADLEASESESRQVGAEAAFKVFVDLLGVIVF